MRNRLFTGPLCDPEPGAGGGDGAPAFDPVKFEAAILDKATKMFNGGLSRIEKQLAALKPPEPSKQADGDPGDHSADPKAKPADAKTERELAKLRADLDAERKARADTEKAAAERDRLSSIKSELAKHGLAEDAVDDAFRFFRDTIKRNESGELVGGDDEIPVADFVKDVVSKRPRWLPPRDVDGTGAKNSPGGRGTPAPFDLNSIKPGMSAEDRARAIAAIAAAANQ